MPTAHHEGFRILDEFVSEGIAASDFPPAHGRGEIEGFKQLLTAADEAACRMT